MNALRHFRILCAVLLTTLLVACNAEEPDKGPATASISGYNHTGEYIHRFFVDKSWGGNATAFGGGGSVCCIDYPSKWHPHLTAKVRWSTSASNPQPYTGTTWHEQVVQIEPYTTPGSDLNVHFLENGNVVLIISNMSPHHPDYPGPKYPQPPAN